MSVLHLRVGQGLGSTQTNLKLQSASPQVQYQQPGSNGFQTLAGASLTGDPDNPQNGDTLTLPDGIGSQPCKGGTATYSTTGTDGAGYYHYGNPRKKDPDDWAATSN